MSRTGISSALAAFIVLTVVLGASTGYLLASPTVETHTTTSTLTSVSTATHTTISTFTSATTETAAATVGIAYKQGIGFYLVNGSGMTLYFRTTDNQSTGTSTCTVTCVEIWPVFYTSNLVLPPGLNASSFSVVTRSDGMKQIDYNGWPLYLFIDDEAAGDTDGQGIGGIWFVYTLPAPSQVTSSSSASSSTSTTSASTTATTTMSTMITSTTTSTASTSSSCYYYC